MGDIPLFSVCIPCFNHGRYIGETIRSVLEQDFDQFEIVVSDNCSTDDSHDVVRSFGDKRIRLFENRYNIGFAPNLQRVTREARGRYMILLSSDDLMRPGALRRYASVFRDQGARADSTIVTSACDVIDEAGRVTYVKYRPSGSYGFLQVPSDTSTAPGFDGAMETVRGIELLRHTILNVIAPGVFCTTAYPRVMWERVEGYDVAYQYMPDSAFLHKLLALDPDYIYVREPLFAYRVHGAGQNAQAAAQGALKQQVDGYIRTFSYPSTVLDRLNLSRDQMVRGFLEEFCLNESLRAVRAGSWVRALKLFAFAFATYPKVAARLSKTYLAGLALLFGPLGTLGVRAAVSLKGRMPGPHHAAAGNTDGQITNVAGYT
jgi:glycosyltransferase involved in cell wall biosynthesis